MNRISSAWNKLKESMQLSTIDIDHLIRDSSPRAQKVVELARQQARRLGHPFIGTEHLLLGLIELGQGVAFNVLKQAGVDFGALHDAVIESAGPGDHTKAMNMIFPTPRMLKVFQHAKEEALLLGTITLGLKLCY